MRRLLAPVVLLVALSSVILPAAAQQRVPQLEPVPPPPPPVGLEPAAEGPEVTITPDQGQIIEEFLVDGKRRVRVRLPNGAEYVLEEDLGDGSYARQQPGDTGIRVPRWIIIRF